MKIYNGVHKVVIYPNIGPDGSRDCGEEASIRLFGWETSRFSLDLPKGAVILGISIGSYQSIHGNISALVDVCAYTERRNFRLFYADDLIRIEPEEGIDLVFVCADKDNDAYLFEAVEHDRNIDRGDDSLNFSVQSEAVDESHPLEPYKDPEIDG